MPVPGYIVLVPLLAATAWVYASVGLGGGTAYLSLMSFWSSDPAVLRPLAWSLNVVAAAVAFVNFRRQGHFDARLAWPFLLGGVLGAAVGGAIKVDTRAFQAMLAITLLAAAVQMLRGAGTAGQQAARKPLVLPSLLLGMAIGLVSGLVGIGGGIVLGPVLMALGWAEVKRLAPITALYILLNSLGALTAFLLRGGQMDLPLTAVFGIVVLAGGFFGSRWGAGKASPTTLQRLFAVVALAAGVKLTCECLGLAGG
jgi:uncharacterized membrane protein YfcA